MKRLVLLLVICSMAAGYASANLGQRRIYPQAQPNYSFTNSRDPNNWWDDVNDVYTLHGLLEVDDINVPGNLKVKDVNVTGTFKLASFSQWSVLFTDVNGLVLEDNTNFIFDDSTDTLDVNGIIVRGVRSIGQDFSSGTYSTAIQKWPGGTVQTLGDILFQHATTNQDTNIAIKGNGTGRSSLGIGIDPQQTISLQVTSKAGENPQIWLSTRDFDSGVAGTFLQGRLANDTGDTYGVIQVWDQGGAGQEALLLQPFGPGLIIGGSAGITTPLAMLHVVGDSYFTDQLDLNDNPIVDVNYFDFNLVNGVAPAEGRLIWNNDEGTLNLGLAGGVVNLQIGLEMVVFGKNTSGGTITNGMVVRISGASGSNPEFGLTDSDSAALAGSIGLATEDILNNQFGYVTTFGLVREVDTSGTPVGEVWSDADRLYASTTAGELTNVPPVADERKIFIGIVLRAHATEGVMWVSVINQAFPHELSGVDPGDLADDVILQYDSGTSTWEMGVPTVDIPIVLTMYDAQPERASETNWNGAFLSLATGQPLDSVPTDIVVTKGIGKIVIVVNAGGDFAGEITVTGETIDRDTGASTPGDTDTITVDTLTTDNSSTDSNGNTKHEIIDAYITSKWFTGTVTLSTTNLTLTDVDVYHCSFEQVNDQPSLILNTFDINLFTTGTAAELDAYLFDLHVTGDKCLIELEAELHLGADGETAIANKYWRLRKGNVNETLDGTTDGFWVDMHYSNTPSQIEDVTAKVWLTCSQELTLN